MGNMKTGVVLKQTHCLSQQAPVNQQDSALLFEVFLEYHSNIVNLYVCPCEINKSNTLLIPKAVA